jgi:AcrR family transcriptional regulator
MLTVATAQLRFSAADRREQILNVATRLFARQGFQGTTTKQISERAKVNEAIIFRHFSSKDELYWAVIERKIIGAAPNERLRERLDPSLEDSEVFSRVAAEILDRRAKDQTLSRLLLFSVLENHRLSHRFLRTYAAGYYDLLAEFIRQRIAEGRFRDVDPLLAARGFLGMVIYHSWVQELFGGKRYQKFDVQQVSRTLADIWLRGMLTAPEGASRQPIKSGNGNHRNHRRKQENASRIQNF